MKLLPFSLSGGFTKGGFTRARRFVAIAIASVFLATAAPAPAQANCYDDFYESFFFCFDIGKLAAWIAQAAVWVAEEAAAAAAYLEEQLEAQIKVITPIVSQQLSSNIKVAGKQGVLDAKRRTLNSVEAGNAAESALLTTQAQSCALSHAGAEAGVASMITGQAVAKLSDISAARGAGTGADSSSVSYAAAEANDRCKLGFIDNSGNGPFGPLPTTLNCTTPPDPKYIDADTRLSTVMTPLQYPLPEANRVNPNTADGHMSFVGAAGPARATENVAGLGSELDYAAAYKFCEHLQPALATPTHNGGNPTVSDVASIRADRNDVALRTAAADECFRALAYRTACPSGAASALSAPGGADCHEAQVQLCARLTNTHQQGGLELKMEGSDPLYAAALANCDDEGISEAMYDAIMAHRCDDRVYAFKVLPMMLGSPEEAERSRVTDCPAQVAVYEKNMQLESRRVSKAIGILMQLPQTSGIGANTAREVH